MSEVYSQDSEYLVLAAMILDRDAGAAALDVGLDREHFYLAESKAYFDAIKESYVTTGMCDTTLVKNALRQKIDKISGKSFFDVFGGETKQTEILLSYTHRDLDLVEKNVDILFEKFNFRNVKKLGLALLESEKYDQITIASTISDLMQSFKTRSEDKVVSLSELASGFVERLQDKYNNPSMYESLHTGFKVLDENSVIQPGTTTFLAARTSSGKSAYLLQMLNKVVESEKSVLLFSSEIDRQEILNRIMSNLSNVDVASLRDPRKNPLKNTAEDTALADACKDVITKKNNFFVYDLSLDVDQLLRIADSIRVRTKLDCIALDYIQNLQFSNGDNRRLEITEAGKKLFNYGKRHNIAMIIVSQLRRSKESMPTIYDLKESGDLENCSDKIILIHRKEENSLKTDSCFYCVAKNRTGRTSEWIEVLFDGEHQKFIAKDSSPTLVPPVTYGDIADMAQEFATENAPNYDKEEEEAENDGSSNEEEELFTPQDYPDDE